MQRGSCIDWYLNQIVSALSIPYSFLFGLRVATRLMNSIVYRIVSAIFYGLTSCILTFINKILLSNLEFPSYLIVGILEMTSTIFIINLLCIAKKIEVPSFSINIVMKIFPLPLLYLINLICGLGGTQMINLPMFTVLRRFTIPFTMALEYMILGVISPLSIQLSVVLMVGGAVLAAMSDLSFHPLGYSFILMNNAATAMNRVCMKKKLEAKEIGHFGLLYYNCILMLPLAFIISIWSGDLLKAISFIISPSMTLSVYICLFIACTFGFLLNFSILICIHYNSALTTTCIGCIKNLMVTYGGFFFSNTIYSMTNIIGINISVIGGLLYTYSAFKSNDKVISVKPKLSKESSKPLLLPRSLA